MITLIGVGHVFRIRETIEQVIRDISPDLVCVELDPQRYQALISEDRPKQASITFRLLARFQRRIAKKFGSSVGDEMLAAIDTANELGIPYAFIDLIATKTMSNATSPLSFREKMGLLFGGIAGMFISKKRVERELKNFEQNGDRYLRVMEKYFPQLKRALIDNRDRYMSGAIRRLHAKYGSIVAIVGDGHVPGMSRILNDLNPKIIRLKQVREGSVKIEKTSKTHEHVQKIPRENGKQALSCDMKDMDMRLEIKNHPSSQKKEHQVSFSFITTDTGPDPER